MSHNFNPSGESKEDFVERAGKPFAIKVGFKLDQLPAGQCLVLLTQDRHFSSIAVIENDDDLKAFGDLSGRRIYSHLIPAEKILEFAIDSDLEAFLRARLATT